MKPCITCAHFSPDQTFLQAAGGMQKEPICNHPNAASGDLVTGVAYCRNERASMGKAGCGKAGKLWTSKPQSTNS